MRFISIFAITLYLALLSAPAQAAFISSSNTVDFSFEGQIEQVGSDQFEVRDRVDGETLVFSRGDITNYPARTGDMLSLAFRVNVDNNILNNPGCGGRFNIIRGGFRGGSDGPCTLTASASVQTDGINRILGQVNNSDNGDGEAIIEGLALVRDDSNKFSLDIANQGFTLSAIELPGITFDSIANQLGSVVPCGDAFRCPTDTITGTANSLTLQSIGIFGDFGTFRPGLNVGYDAGTWGSISISGSFQGIGLFGGTPPTPVPAPPVMLLFGLVTIALIWRQRKVCGL